MTVDAMENVFPEHWPSVIREPASRMRPRGHLYLTVEEIDEAEIDARSRRFARAGLPAVRGEVIEGDVAGYHYYPGRGQVGRWVEAEGLEIVAKDTEPQDGWAYWHLLLRAV